MSLGSNVFCWELYKWLTHKLGPQWEASDVSVLIYSCCVALVSSLHQQHTEHKYIVNGSSLAGFVTALLRKSIHS